MYVTYSTRILLKLQAKIRSRKLIARLVEIAGEGGFPGFPETVRLLLDRGADVHARQEEALRLARVRKHEAVIALLLERGAVDIPA